MQSRFVLFALIAFLPLASAGPGASVSTLESEQGCEESYDYSWSAWNGNDSWYYNHHGEWASSCADTFDYVSAEAHDDQGAIAGVRLGGEQGNASESSWDSYDYGWPGGSASGGESNWSHSSWWNRGASAQTRVGSVSAGESCASDGSSARWSSSDSYSSHTSAASSDAFRCGVDASSGVAGVPVEAFVGESCAASTQSYDGVHGEPSSSTSYRHATSTSGCARGADVGAAGQDASGGIGPACESRAGGYESDSGNETSSFSHASSHCRDGVTVSGPDGIALFAGVEDHSWESCRNGACEGAASRSVGASLDWQHSPLGPYGPGLWYTLP